MIISLASCSESESIARIAQSREVPHMAILRTICRRGNRMPHYEYTSWIGPDADLYSTALLNILNMEHVFPVIVATDGSAGEATS
ncbi:hypothetical protein FGIG_06185 [Fasciola gigantica]|uniref:Uncharacterized protein n=1 Tax=Fasciola gigantica TaxID=46835 RepID=A0A504Z0Q5_FASGI|nr:hypothetical protein FGIG_06185 [Fasciola gigantica]